LNIILVVFDTLRKDCVGVFGSPSWGEVHVPHFQAFAVQSLLMTRAYPNVLPTLPARVALYTGRQVYPFERGDFHLKGDFVGAPGWGPIPEEHATLAEMLSEAGYRTALISDLYHQFKPSKNFWRGFDQWTFLRGREIDPARSGPRLSPQEIDYWLPRELRALRNFGDPSGEHERDMIEFIQQCILNLRGRQHETDFFSPRVFQEAALWLEQNQDAEKFFLTIECFDPHEPWLVPPHYRKMYLSEDGPEQVITFYSDVSGMGGYLLKRTRANYRGSVTQCDRWFGHLMETLRVLGRLDDTLVILTADHGHTIGETNYMGKQGYPSRPEVFDIPLMVRFPGAEHAGLRHDGFVQHVDLTASILEAAGVVPPDPLDGRSFLRHAVAGQPGTRDHVTVGWGSTPTVIDDRWWFNAKVDGTGPFLYDLTAADPFSRNVADEHRDVVDALFRQARQDAGGQFPNWLIELAKGEADAPGCSQLAARP
jgi:arylsulfatase A-like enzyme